MNIHFTDKKIFKDLKSSSLVNIDIGSSMYGTTDNSSDVDRLYIYIPSKEDDLSFTSTHHQFQYKEDGVDHLFINIHDFISNALNGDSTINFESINYEALKDSEVSFLYDMRFSFHNYKIVRSYLGLCRRDIKYLNKGGTSERDKNKKLGHILRGYKFAKAIIDGDFSPTIDGYLLEKITKIKSFNYEQRFRLTGVLQEKISIFRDRLNAMLDDNTLGLPSYMKEEDQDKLDTYLHELSKTDSWKEKKKDSLGLLSLIYDVNENDIQY